MKFPSHRRDFLLKVCNTNVLSKAIASSCGYFLEPIAVRSVKLVNGVLLGPMEFTSEGELAPVLNLPN